MRVKDLFYWINERHDIAVAKTANRPKPWTQDPILQTYRFCNVYREADTVTQWIGKNWRKPNAKDPHLWFAMTVARFINWPGTLEDLGYPCKILWDPMRFLQTVRDRQAQGFQVYGGAYTISTNGRKMLKHEYLVEQVFQPLWANREQIEAVLQTPKMTLAKAHTQLTQFQGMGGFMAAQVIADLKYAQLTKAPDWWTWAASGPGSRRGLVRVLCQSAAEGGERKNTPWREDIWLTKLQELHAQINPLIQKTGMPALHAQDLQNCLCEFDKYERVKLGEGRPRSLYPGGISA